MDPNQNLNPTPTNSATPEAPTMAASAAAPVAAPTAAPTAQMSVEQQMMAEIQNSQIEEQQKAAAEAEAAAKLAEAEADKPQQNKGMLIGLIVAAVVAVGGIGFGVFSMISGNQKTDNLNKQIATLKSQNSELQNQIADASTLNGDEALALLNEAASEQKVGYEIGYANVYAKYNGDDDTVSYWVKYLPINVSVGAKTANDIIFTLGDDNEWEFELPGFVTYTQTLIDDYVLLDGSEIVLNNVVTDNSINANDTNSNTEDTEDTENN